MTAGRLLVLRPEPQASLMAAEFRALGFEASVAPLLEIRPAEDLRERLAAGLGKGADLVIFTSAHGVRALGDAGLVGGISEVAVIAVGPATAKAARGAGFRRVSEAGGDAGEVVAAVMGMPAPVMALHIAGRDRTGDIAGRLTAAGHHVAVVEAYEAVAADKLPADVAAGLAGDGFDVVVVGSTRTAETFAGLLPAAGSIRQRPAVAAISAAAAAPLRSTFAVIEAAATPTGPALVAAAVALAGRVRKNAAAG